MISSEAGEHRGEAGSSRDTCTSYLGTDLQEQFSVILTADPGDFSGTPEARFIVANLENRHTKPRSQTVCAGHHWGILMGQLVLVVTTGGMPCDCTFAMPMCSLIGGDSIGSTQPGAGSGPGAALQCGTRVCSAHHSAERLSALHTHAYCFQHASHHRTPTSNTSSNPHLCTPHSAPQALAPPQQACAPWKS